MNGERGKSEIMDHYDGPTVLHCKPMSSLNDIITFPRDLDNCFGCVKYFWNFKIDSYKNVDLCLTCAEMLGRKNR